MDKMSDDETITSEDSRSSDDESMGSLKDFIAEESVDSGSEEDESGSETELSEESSDEESDSESEDDDKSVISEASKASKASKASNSSEKEPLRPSKKIKLTKEKEDEIAELKAEAERFIAGTGGSTIGQRTLRSRDPDAIEKRKPKDTYYEKYAKQEEAKLMEKFKKKDIIDFLKKLEPEWRLKYEEAGHEWPNAKMTMTLDAVEELYKPIKAFADLPDSDEEDSDEASIESDEEESGIESEESI